MPKFQKKLNARKMWYKVYANSRRLAGATVDETRQQLDQQYKDNHIDLPMGLPLSMEMSSSTLPTLTMPMPYVIVAPSFQVSISSMMLMFLGNIRNKPSPLFIQQALILFHSKLSSIIPITFIFFSQYWSPYQLTHTHLRKQSGHHQIHQSLSPSCGKVILPPDYHDSMKHIKWAL
jgi:hypothetical protein